MRTIKACMFSAVVFLAMACPQLSAAESIKLKLDRRGYLAMLNNTPQVTERFGNVNLANWLGCVHDEHTVYLSRENANTLRYPLFVDTACLPSGKAARAILAAGAEPNKKEETAITTAKVKEPPAPTTTVIKANIPVGRLVTLQAAVAGSWFQLESGSGLAKIELTPTGVWFTGTKLGVVQLAFVSEGGSANKYIITLTPAETDPAPPTQASQNNIPLWSLSFLLVAVPSYLLGARTKTKPQDVVATENPQLRRELANQQGQSSPGPYLVAKNMEELPADDTAHMDENRRLAKLELKLRRERVAKEAETRKA